MIYRTLGATGEKVSAIGLGGFHIGKPLLESTSIKIIRSAIERGITFMDNCWDYHDGKSEIRMGKALRDGYRNKVKDRLWTRNNTTRTTLAITPLRSSTC